MVKGNSYPTSEAQRITTTLLNAAVQGLRLVSDRPKGSDFETLPRLAQRPRYRPRRLEPWR
jgi:hypothetical protein